MSLLLDAPHAPTIRHVPRGRRSPHTDAALVVAELAGLDLFDWQADVLVDSMQVSGDKWTSREVGVVVGRQNGKGAILEARQLAGLFVLGEPLQVHSAHQFKTCYEHFRRLRDKIESSDLLMDQVEIIRTGAGDQAIELKNGNRIRFVARKGGSGRGFSAQTVYLDEAFELGDDTFGDLLPTMMAMPNAQVWFTSSAPHTDSAVLHRVRERGIRGDDPRLMYVEWGNDADADPLDRESWARANPSIGVLIDPDEIEAAQRSMSPAMFAREHLGVPEMPESEAASPVPLERWSQLVDADSLPVKESVRLALDVPPERTSATVAIAGKRDDNLLHACVYRHVAPPDMNDLVLIVAELVAEHGTPIILPPNSPAKAWRSELVAAGINVDELTHAEYAEACGLMMSKVTEGTIRHRGVPEMTNAVAGLGVRRAGDVDIWSRRSSSSNIAPFVAATCGLVRVANRTDEIGEWFVDLDDFEED